MKIRMIKSPAVFALALGAGLLVGGQKLTLNVKIVNRQNQETQYTYVVPGHFVSNSTASASCFGSSCTGSSQTTGTSMPAQAVSFSVHGATFALQLPDGRVAVVNCESKFAERLAGPAGNKRSCRMPLVDDIQAEFDGDKAKLKWPVSLDGKKIESETYKILAVLAPPTPSSR